MFAVSQHNTRTLQPTHHAHSCNTRSKTRAKLMSASSDQLIKVDFVPRGNSFSKQEVSVCQPLSNKERTSNLQPKSFHPTNPFINAGAQISFSSNINCTNPFLPYKVSTVLAAN